MKKILAKGLALLALTFGYISCATTNNVSSEVAKALENQNKVIEQMKEDYETKFKQLSEKLKKPINTGYDNAASQISDETLEKMLNNSFSIRVDVSYKNNISGKKTRHAQRGTAFLAENKEGRQYFITCEHIADMKGPLPNVWSGEKFEIEKYKTTITINNRTHELEILSANSDYDIAVLISKTDLGLEKQFDFSDKEIKKGDVVYAAGFPSSGTFRLGKLLTPGAVLGFGEGNLSRFIFVNSDFNPGNSGGPVYVIENGEPKIAGVAASSFRADGVYGAVHYKHAKAELEKAIKNYEKSQSQTEKKD